METSIIQKLDEAARKIQIEAWIDELRSGKYTQIGGKLSSENGYCCLGVACKLLIPKHELFLDPQKNDLVGSVPREQPNAPVWLKKINQDFQAITGIPLVALNDGLGKLFASEAGIPIGTRFSFDEIADLLQAVYIEEVLK